MAHKESKWPKIETAIAIKKEDCARLCEIFNTAEWKKINNSIFFDVKYYNPENIISQHMSVKEQNFNAIKKRWEEVNRFRNGYIRQHLTSIDIEGIVRVGGVITEFFEGFICDNLGYNPFEKFVLDMTAKRNRYQKEKRNILQTQAKKVSNTIYGYTKRSDIEDVYKCVSCHWMKTEYDDRVIEWFPLKYNKIMVKIADHKGVDDNGYSEKINSQPCHFGSFILSHSK